MKNSTLTSSRFKVATLSIILVFATVESTYAKFWGWESSGGRAVACGNSGYTVNHETYYVFGIAVSDRNVWRDANNNVVDPPACADNINSMLE